jgi:class 3 adenylate cyclase
VLCPSCQIENPDASKFCRECGTRLSTLCTECGSQLAPGSKFCPECGARQVAASVAATAAATATGTAAPSVATAERRVVSVVFLDLVGFTTLAEGRDAEEIRELLGRYFELARQTVGRYGGVIEKFIGDAVMAVWGTPTAHEDDAERAVRAALDLVEGVRTLGAPDALEQLSARAGVLTGEAAVTLGDEQQAMLAGDLVNTAARLQAAAAAGSVLVGDPTRRATEGSIAYEPAGEHELKGKAAPVPAFRAQRVIAKRRGEGRTELVEPPFAGREAELRLLKDLFHATGSERRPRLVSVLGQAGIGKSRLAWELLKYVDGVTELAYWHQGRSPAYGEGVAFWALGEMVRGRAGIAEGEADDAARQKLAAILDQFVPDPAERDWIRPRLEELLGLGMSREDDAPASRESVFAAWRTFFERIGDQGTVVLVFEDLHWADAGLLDFIEHLLDWSRGCPIFILALARPELLERRSDWGIARRNAVSLPLEPLGAAAMRELLDGMLPGLSDSHAAAILGRAEGIPLYAVETIRMLVNDGRLERIDDRYRPVGELGELAVPESLHALIAARLDTLEPPERQLLQAASVLGKTFAVDAVAAIAGEEAASVEPRLRDLVRRELLVIDVDPRSPERGQYGFVQALMREVAYSTLARRERRRLHLAAARHFETTGDEEISGILATHYVAAHEAQPDGPEGDAVAAQARVALRAAAERAGRLGSWDRAFAYLRQALMVTGDIGDRADLLEAAGTAARLSAQNDEAVAALEEAVRLRATMGDRRALLAATARFGRAVLSRGTLEVARDLLQRAADEFADLAESAEYVELAGPLTQVQMRLGDDARGIELADRVLPTAERLGTIAATLEVLINRGTSLSNLNRPIEGAATLVGAIDLARLHEMPQVEIRAIVNLSLAAEVDEPRVAQHDRALELIARYGLRAYIPFVLNNYSEDALARGDWDEALRQVALHAQSAITEHEREQIASLSADIEALRGELGSDEMERAYAPWAEQLDDPQLQAGLSQSSLRLALSEGRLADVIHHGLAAVASYGAIGVSELGDAGHAAIRLRQTDRAREIRALIVARPGRMAANHQRVLDAGLAALEGRTVDALEGYREAIAVWREVGYSYWVAMTEATMVAVLDLPPADLRDIAADARERFTAMGARPLLAHLDASLAARMATIPEQASAMSGGPGKKSTTPRRAR